MPFFNTDDLNAALLARLDGDATLLSLGNTGVWETSAPQGTPLPYSVFQKVDGRPAYTHAAYAGHVLIYVVKFGAPKFSERDYNFGAAARRYDELLIDWPLAVAGFQTAYLRRREDVDYEEVNRGTTNRWVGGRYRIEMVPL